MLSFLRSAGLLVLLGGLSAAAAHAAETPYSILYSFQSAEGYPAAGLISDGRGNLYGTTSAGGPSDGGTVFTIRSDGSGFRSLHDFLGGGSDGLNPRAPLILDGFGNLYGTADGGLARVGIVFTIKVDGGGFQVLHSFADGVSDGAYPEGSLTLDGSGNLYGTTGNGGTGVGTVFKLRTDGTGFQLLHSFSSGTSAESAEGSPAGSLLLDGSGNLYGTTVFRAGPPPGGGPPVPFQGWGNLFRIKTDGTGFQLLRNFPSGTSGGIPFGSLIADASGKLYGTTFLVPSSICGTLFTIEKDGSGFQILHTFAGGASDGCEPSGLVLDRSGNLYGTAQGPAQADLQVIFKVRTDGTGYQILHTFDRGEGITPAGSLILDGSETLYGTMSDGGLANAGTVFSINTDGSRFQVLHAFIGLSGYGESPFASLISDRSGFFYGTTTTGGVANAGTVFRIRSDGTGFEVLHTFLGDANYRFGPEAALILDGAGNLYGTTPHGGVSNGGAVFKVRTDGTGFEILHTFLGGASDGSDPAAALILDGAGNLYGTTKEGGPTGGGTVFRMKTDGTGFQLLHTFTFPTSLDTSIDGGVPDQSLVLDGSGNLYGTAPYGGSSHGGTVFRVRTDGTDFEVLHSFGASAGDGSGPSGSLIMDAFGNFYGTTAGGGASGGGTVFKITIFKLSQGTNFQLLHSFAFNSSDGGVPEAVVLDSFGNLYGTTIEGGPSHAGTVFTVRTDGTGFRTLHAFGGVANDGLEPLAPLLLDGFGNLYGTTMSGGTSNSGTIFALWIGRSRVPVPGPFEPVRKR